MAIELPLLRQRRCLGTVPCVFGIYDTVRFVFVNASRGIVQCELRHFASDQADVREGAATHGHGTPG